jgi:hypothetical protein
MNLNVDFLYLVQGLLYQKPGSWSLEARILEGEITFGELIREFLALQGIFFQKYQTLQEDMINLGDRIRPRNSFDYNDYSLHFEPDRISPMAWTIYKKEEYRKKPNSPLGAISDISLDCYSDGAGQMHDLWDRFVRLAKEYKEFLQSYVTALRSFAEGIGYFFFAERIFNDRNPMKDYDDPSDSIQEETVFCRGPFRFSVFLSAERVSDLYDFRRCHLSSTHELLHHEKNPPNAIFGSPRFHRSWRNDIPESMQDEYQTMSFAELFHP